MVRRGDCYWVDLQPVVGHEQAGLRPVLVLSVDRFNERARMVIVVPLTTKQKRSPPLELDVGLVGGKQAYALPTQVRALSTARLRGLLEAGRQRDVERCLDAILQLCGRLPPMAVYNDVGGGE